MKSRHVLILISFLIIFDALAINIAFGVIFLADIVNGSGIGVHAALMILVNATWFASALVNKTYAYRNVQFTELLYRKSAFTFIGQILMLGAIFSLFSQKIAFNESFFYLLITEFVAVTIVRYVTYLSERFYIKMDGYKKNVAFIGGDDIGLKLEQFFLNNRLSVKFAGSFQELPTPSTSIGTTQVDELRKDISYAIENHLDEVYTTQFPGHSKAMDQLLELAERNCVRVKFVASPASYLQDSDNFASANYLLSNFYDGIPILTNRPEPLNLLSNRVVKRAFDIAFSLFVIVFILSWFVPLMTILIRLESRGSAIFRQLRSGRDNKPFYCYKFRSMRINDQSHHKQASKGDPRITRIGAFIRKTSIDELPQFFNVLKGNMSIVGPRPHMLKHTEEYSKIINKYMVRHFLKPGITGWAQVNGFRGETKEPAQMLGRVNHDIWYMENWSLFTDIKIIYKTVRNALKGEDNAF
ncbi:exopolysaccharide biosynthesis polyprenyl glycosylphosphotransferase [Pedobacter frigidisoli]|uniref:Exopolysaccharide biosynthesis polyprenyl glycosylphosphotransferase n=1 Tax=Pedobacter frigidisoli TaxID=2530455 RepID=A0A4R0NQA1_9SPHI|nr:exopolysaccharide biosynthesis polyprenyl glycosylphosphotransferase [Pedobacter frigidisoli]TCD01973.1 exopolysaccharide biosynthesis polyprenyl glycosylphosphotransferase [Pedobacter frigidisoli]